jgi:hypothetical protein
MGGTMSTHGLPPEVGDVIAAFDSTDQLEVLFLLSRNPSKAFHSREIVQTLGLAADVVETTTAVLRDRRLIASVHEHLYQYAPATIKLHAAVEELAVMWRMHPRVIDQELSKRRNAGLGTFADAFRVRVRGAL